MIAPLGGALSGRISGRLCAGKGVGGDGMVHKVPFIVMQKNMVVITTGKILHKEKGRNGSDPTRKRPSFL